MNKVLLNAVHLDGEFIIKKGGNSGGGGNSGSGGNSGGGSSDVRFLDYDGTLLHSFSKDDFLALSALPDLPTRAGLTCQGWNYTLENAQEYVASYGVLDIGATYITDDGKTRLYIKITAEGRMTVPLYFSQTVANGVTIDWGDGSATETLSGTDNVNTTHTYSEIGEYTISLNPADGCTLGLGHGSSSYCVMGSKGNNGLVYCNMLQAVEIGKNVTEIGTYTFVACYSLASVVIPEGVTSIGGYAFNSCGPLSSVVIPQSVTSIGDYVFGGCYSLSSVVIPKSVKSISIYAFGSCYSLVSIVIPESVTSIGKDAFYWCYSLSSVVIPKSVKSIGERVFDSCDSLVSIVIPESVTSIGREAFSSCDSLASIVIPSSVRLIDASAFASCKSLTSIVIPQGVTSIGGSAFLNCYSLASIVIPSSITSIGFLTFQNCYGMAYYDFRASTAVPTLSGSAFSSIPSDCKIVVPDALYDTWIAATNWSTYASYIVKASEFNG